VTKQKNIKEPQQKKAAKQEKAPKQEKVSKPKEPEKKQPKAAAPVKTAKAAAERKGAASKKVPKKETAAKGGDSSLEAQLEALKRENEALKAQLAAAIERANHLAEVTGSVVRQLDGVISVIRGLVQSSPPG
jgi:hypothetical protein